ncbi:MAG TPA: c-type cytochrome [SAR86 cluster bacterium]|jgi:cytochrome c553|nr:c-type cytochrome [SAR86 cluster bacterium]HJM14885.1 c-type cytochrome [SAR86 cluster bacterium]|tara:strand:+ start:1967 stop:2590 length:624 start_codon:yes stop_codon:yes gene_type:complete
MRFKLSIIFISSILLTGVGDAPSVKEKGDAETGKQLVSACSACHGADGNSLAGIWPSLAGQNYKYLLKQLRLVKSGGRQIVEMTGQLDNLSDQDLKDISAFYSVQNNVIGQVEKDKLELGRKLYYSGNLEKGVPACTACHSPRGLGNAPAAYPLLSGQQPDYVTKALKDYRSGERSNEDPSKIMIAIAYKLDDIEIEALSSFVHGLH